jgi:sulfinoalanine decarboxylase
MDSGHLREQIQKARADGRTPFLVNATCATTVFGSFDDLEMLAEVCQQEKMWLHLDAALGGSMVLSDKHRHLMKGSHLADSITWNPHKLLGVPLQCSAILTKHESLLTEAHAANAKYLFQKDKLNIQHDTGDKSIQCGRKVDVLKLWMAWKVQGENGFAARIDRMMEISQYLRDEIVRRGQRDGSLELVSEPYMSNVCFLFIPPSARGPNAPKKGTPEWTA